MYSRITYTPPNTNDLQHLKQTLGCSGSAMADLAGLAGPNQWRKYTGGVEPREVSLHMAFFVAARLVLSQDEIVRIFNRMREMGCEVGEA